MPDRAALSLPQHQTENRSADRKAISLRVQSTSSTGVGSYATASNLSRTGLLLEADVHFSIGENILLDLPHSGLTAATVVWSGKGLFGCMFSKAISSAALAAAQLQSPAAGETSLRSMARGAEPFHARLRRLRKQRGLGVAELADQLQVSKPTIWNWETGKAHPRTENMTALARSLGISVPELLFQDEAASETVGHSSPRRFETDDPSDRYGQDARENRSESRLAQLITASKEQIAALAGTDATKIKILVEF